MTLREKAIALVTILALNGGVWATAGLFDFSPFVVAVAALFTFLSVAAVNQVLFM